MSDQMRPEIRALFQGDERFADYLWERRQEVEAQIKSQASRISQQMESIARKVDEDMHLNDLGELQGQGSQLDRLIGLRQELIQVSKRFEGTR